MVDFGAHSRKMIKSSKDKREPSSWCDDHAKGAIIRLKIQPRASSTQIVGLFGDNPRLKIRLAAPPIDGKANEALLKFLREVLAVPLSRLSIVRGETATTKDVLCLGMTRVEIEGHLKPWLDKVL